MNNNLNFTMVSLKNLPNDPAGKHPKVYHDTQVRGLTLMVSPLGTKTFYFSKKIHGRSEKIKIGRFPDVSVEQARVMAHEHNVTIAKGDNPQDKRRAFNQEVTFGELHAWFIENYAKHHKAPSSVAQDIGQFKRHLSDWRNRKISSITEYDVAQRHQYIGQNNGKYTANRTLELIRVMFNKAIELRRWSGTNPTRGTKKFQEISRDRFLQADECERFFDSVNADENTTVRDYILLSLLTGQRKSNMLAMRWDEISFPRLEWRIPKTKNGEPLTVHLSPQAIEILEQRKANAGKYDNSEWVFPAESKSGHLEDPKKAWERILKRADIQGLRIHDLRRTLGSWQTALGASSFIVGKSLGHKTLQATAIYARLNLDPVRTSVNAAADALFSAAKGTK